MTAVLCAYMYVFFFKQKTAYEMRISDWSSDVCSSDLVPNAGKILYGAFKDSWKTSHDQFTKLAFERGYMNQEVAELERQFSAIKTPGAMRSFLFGDPKANPSTLRGRIAKNGGLDYSLGFMRSEERSVGKECVSKFRSGWWRYHKINTTVVYVVLNFSDNIIY